jgi:hypothetical protein
MTATPESKLTRFAALLVVLCSLQGCADEITDIGFVGTWKRELAGGYSILAIDKTENDYRVRWSKIDKLETTSCDDAGMCDTYVGDRKVYEWRIRAFLRPPSEDLFVELSGIPLDGATASVGYTDRLVLESGGLELLSYPAGENGDTRDPASKPLRFRKISDDPAGVYRPGP